MSFVINPPISRLTVALFLLLLLALVQFSSNGIVRGGDDNDGSGIGGTGRSLPASGGSGIGGTGFKPFLGMSADQEIEIMRDPERRDSAITNSLPEPLATPVLLTKIPAVAQVTRAIDVTTDSSAIDISEAIQASIESDGLILEQLRSSLDQQLLTAATSIEPELEYAADPNTETASQPVTWDAVAALLQGKPKSTPSRNNMAESGEFASVALSQEDSARLTRPEKIQRPQLPPIQRVSPLRRSAILPPRIQPMRL